MSPHPLFLVFLSSLLSSAQGWGNGYTQAMCTSLAPPDGSPQTSSSPYSITLTVAQYTEGGEVKGRFVWQSFFPLGCYDFYTLLGSFLVKVSWLILYKLHAFICRFRIKGNVFIFFFSL